MSEISGGEQPQRSLKTIAECGRETPTGIHYDFFLDRRAHGKILSQLAGDITRACVDSPDVEVYRPGMRREGYKESAFEVFTRREVEDNIDILGTLPKWGVLRAIATAQPSLTVPVSNVSVAKLRLDRSMESGDVVAELFLTESMFLRQQRERDGSLAAIAKLAEVDVENLKLQVDYHALKLAYLPEGTPIETISEVSEILSNYEDMSLDLLPAINRTKLDEKWPV